jgi:hypothetical protein
MSAPKLAQMPTQDTTEQIVALWLRERASRPQVEWVVFMIEHAGEAAVVLLERPQALIVARHLANKTGTAAPLDLAQIEEPAGPNAFWFVRTDADSFWSVRCTYVPATTKGGDA